MYKDHLRCRACGWGQAINPGGIKSAPSTERLKPVFDLGLQPLANDFSEPGGQHAGFAPLKVMLCPQCSLAQLSVVVDTSILYRHYLYVTSASRTMQEHFETIAQEMALEAGSKRLLEIGSNDGALLDFLSGRGWQVMGVDPAQNLCAKAKENGMDVVCDFWGKQSGASLAGFKPGIVLARHVFCHVDDWRDFIRGLELVATDDTLICIEVPWVQDLLDKGEFDTIYHEHTSYLSVKAVSALLQESRFRLHKVIHMPIHGGALFLMLRVKGHEAPPHKSVSEFMNREECGEEKWKVFDYEATVKLRSLLNLVYRFRDQGKRVVGYGASAKSTVWINACKFTRNQIEAVYDCTVEKLFRCIPGTDIPIVHEGGFYVDGPDYAICFAWNFREEILAKQAKWLKSGGKFIFPHPSIEVVGADGPVPIELATAPAGV